MISRVGFCQDCFDRNRPQSASSYLVFGSTRREFFFYQSKRRGLRGYTPHLYVYLGLTDSGFVRVKSTCSMCSCGVNVGKEKNGSTPFDIKHYDLIKMTVKNWNSLINYTHDKTFEI